MSVETAMSVPVLTFFNNKGGVGKTSLAYHLAWMFADSGHRVLAADLDPQANLTAAFLGEEEMEELWDRTANAANTIYQCVRPLTEVGDVREPCLQTPDARLALLAGDLRLSGFEEQLSAEWPKALGGDPLYRPFRLLTAFWQVIQMGARSHGASLVVLDIGPNLGAINRSALIASDYVVIPLNPDLFSMQGLRNLGPVLRRWRDEWRERRQRWSQPKFALPLGQMKPAGYVAQQHTVRLDRPVRAYERWMQRMPMEYRRSVLDEPADVPLPVTADPHCLAALKHFRSLVPMAHEARKPVFHLTVADGAIGAHASAVQGARRDYEALAVRILAALSLSSNTPPDRGGA